MLNVYYREAALKVLVPFLVPYAVFLLLFMVLSSLFLSRLIGKPV